MTGLVMPNITQRYLVPATAMALSGVFGAFGVDIFYHTTSAAQAFAALMFPGISAIIWIGSILFMYKGKLP